MNQKIKLFFLLIAIVLVQFPLNAQEHNKKPKVALVLSGGGAKGIAHIPVLQKLDSLGIVPDLVIGTSMGSVVGGLYSMGYSGNDIAKLITELDWNHLLGGSVTLSLVGNEEKSEFDNYLLDLNWKNNQPSISTALLNDQNLREFLAILTYPVYGVHNFDHLPIPYRAIATDIVHGKEVVMKEGSLLTAMRASMSIPSVFKPVDYNETLLVDGGILNNFPTDVAKELGADIIIGSDVGGGLKDKEELDNIASLLFQTSMLVSNIKNPVNRKLCDVLINHTPNLTFSTGDFNKSDGIYEEGKIATNEKTDALSELAQKLKGFKQRKVSVPEAPEKFTLDTIVYKKISEGNLELVKSRIELDDVTPYTPKDIVNGVNKLMGTNLFNQIVVIPKVKDSLLQLELNGVEKSKHQVRVALHYDTYRDLGAIVNYTGRNILGDASRTLFTFDISEQPKLRLQHQKIFGQDHKWWWRSELLWLKLKQKVFVNGFGLDLLKSNTLNFDFQFNRNLIVNKSYVGFGLLSSTVRLESEIKPGSDGDFGLERYKFKDIGVDVHFNYNSFDEVFYSKRGTFVHASVNQSFVHKVDLRYTDDSENINGDTNDYTKANVVYERRVPISGAFSMIIGAQGAFVFQQDLTGDDISFNDQGDGAKYYIGGNVTRPLRDAFVFAGLDEDELIATQFMSVKLGVQYHPFKKVFIQPHGSLASVGFGGFGDYVDHAFSPEGSWNEREDVSAIFSVGSTFSYHSLLGPINLDVSYVNDLDRIRVFLGIGFQLGRSN
ncbi:patatin-like phospholipase family protein [Tamlana agarivorans]|uniref:Patatin-like phospholipase family protein n=1 Tax=Pseudotamlana agarivorans TaxID=481183 RepID=A0ACC5UCG5_9FLAO|nr:patatin-like phospholipase family protein [Tamlana agarivorans]MBU2951934.1 patatin-like phospholipase family protein [Tamlana agarivorans]